jgi:glycosyltransferase involved in cell wall biosynthesis
MTETAAARIAWRDPRYLRTHRGLLVYRVPGEAGFAQAEADVAPKNLVIARHPQLGWRLVHLHDDSAQVRPPPAIVAALCDATQSTVIEGVTIEATPGPDNFALRREKLYLSSGKASELLFVAAHRMAWEVFEGATPGPLAYQLWRPGKTMGGTQLMQFGLAERLGAELDAINLQLHWPDPKKRDDRPLVVWVHNDAGPSFGWCGDAAMTQAVAAFVFVSHWQRQRFLTQFPALPAERCHVIRNATDTSGAARSWPVEKPWRWRCAYTSAPDRGLSILLDAWERLDPADAELHIWSSFRLWGNRFSDTGYQAVFAHARRLPSVTYHGIRPNAEIRQALRDMHFLTYPSTFNETSCIAVMEAISAGVRVIGTARAALPETTAGFARLYAAPKDRDACVAAFARELAEEFRNPWGGQPGMAATAQAYAREAYGWPICLDAWRQLIGRLTGPAAHGF